MTTDTTTDAATPVASATYDAPMFVKPNFDFSFQHRARHAAGSSESTGIPSFTQDA
jgi:hypothetical protein